MKCRRCPADADPGKAMCAFHRAASVAEAEARRKRRMEAGLCMSCPASALPGQCRCASCAARNTARSTERAKREKGPDRCTKCNGPKSEGAGKLCARCVMYLRAYAERKRAEHAAAGLCAKCKRPRLEGLTLCQYHSDLQYLENQKRRPSREKVQRGNYERCDPLLPVVATLAPE